MNIERAVLGAILFLVLVIGANVIMYGIARGVGKGDSRWLQSLTKNLAKPLEHKSHEMDELHRRVQKLSEKDKSGE